MPSLLSAPYTHLAKAIRELEDAGVALFHYDVMDGHFVPNLTGGTNVISSLEPVLRGRLDVHLMVTNPGRVVPWFDFPSVRSITIHIEIQENLRRIFEHIRGLSKQAGVSLNPDTPVETLEPVLRDVDQVLVMTVHPGQGGQDLIPETLEKVRQLNRWRNERGFGYVIQVDGGIRADNIREVHEAGADEIVAGAAVFDHPDPPRAFQHLERLIREVSGSASLDENGR
ncbi:MAG TPA: ribulose-phosphate 3-epimerase [bacterium]|nr:ribulose-phosphate 3-epimerase [bacterium]HOL94658.1 ribulose-phosphate 3-epimerase [bacterium]HPP03076.1 ribulose-phosphate 3-epimerase [bacterium]HXK94840.1 ribulose-phosphate 3-epimerase [bacterium]